MYQPIGQVKTDIKLKMIQGSRLQCEVPSEGGVSPLDYLPNDKMNIINYPLSKPKERVMIGGFFM